MTIEHVSWDDRGLQVWTANNGKTQHIEVEPSGEILVMCFDEFGSTEELIRLPPQ